MNKYIGHPGQLGGVEEVTLAKGKGKGMNLLQIKNTKGVDITLVCDRCLLLCMTMPKAEASCRTLLPAL